MSIGETVQDRLSPTEQLRENAASQTPRSHRCDDRFADRFAIFPLEKYNRCFVRAVSWK